MKVTMLLADAAQAINGKLYVLGGGCSLLAIGSPCALAVKVEVPWTDANVAHRIAIELLDADGRQVLLRGPEGDLPVRLDTMLEVGRPIGVAAGTPLDAVLALNFAPLPLKPGARYLWRVWINDEVRDTVGFSTRTSA